MQNVRPTRNLCIHINFLQNVYCNERNERKQQKEYNICKYETPKRPSTHFFTFQTDILTHLNKEGTHLYVFCPIFLRQSFYIHILFFLLHETYHGVDMPSATHFTIVSCRFTSHSGHRM